LNKKIERNLLDKNRLQASLNPQLTCKMLPREDIGNKKKSFSPFLGKFETKRLKKLINFVRSLCTETYVTILIYFVKKELKTATS